MFVIPEVSSLAYYLKGNCPLPEVSIIMGVYESEQSVARSLSALYAQTFTDFEILMMDSSKSDGVEEIVRTEFPDVIFRRSPIRLSSEAARNQIAPMAQGNIFVFTDPDIYPNPTWLETLVSTYYSKGCVLAGAIDCYGDRWLDVAMHICNFDIWLSGGVLREMPIGATSNMLCPRDIFEEIGGFPDVPVSGDTVFCWDLTQRGYDLLFVPEATVYHHHLSTWRDFLKEQFFRGIVQASLRPEWFGWNRNRIILQLVVSILPIRLLKLTARAAANARRAQLFREFVLSLPVIVSGQSAWLLGASITYARTLLGNIS